MLIQPVLMTLFSGQRRLSPKCQNKHKPGIRFVGKQLMFVSDNHRRASKVDAVDVGKYGCRHARFCFRDVNDRFKRWGTNTGAMVSPSGVIG